MLSHNYIASMVLLISSVVGVGMFTLPYISIKSGIVTIIIYFIILGFIQHWLHKLYAEIILSTKKQHRLPGYAEKYLGKHSKKIILALSMFSGYGALLAYTIIGGDFLYQLLHPYFGGPLLLYSCILLAVRGVIMLFGLAWVTRVEMVLTGGLIGSIIIISLIASGNGSFSNLTLFNSHNLMLAYGPIFFAVSGILAVNDICLTMKKEKEKIASALRSGIIVAITIMILFIVAITSISGQQTSPDALSGLQGFVDPLFYTVLLVIGLVTVTAAFFMMAEAMEEMFIWDFKIKKNISWLLIWIIPLILLLIGARDVTKVIAITGAISGGLLGSLYLLLGLKVKKKPEIISPIKVQLTPKIAYSLTILFIIGLGYQLWEIFG